MINLITKDKVMHGNRLAEVLGGEICLVKQISKVKIRYLDTNKIVWIDSQKLKNFDLIEYMKELKK